MLHRRLTFLTAGAVALALSGCSEGGAIEENVVRPGITAITDEAPAAACTANASILRTAIDAYTVLEGEPPPDEQALVDAELLREPTTDWDVVDGELVAENPACGAVERSAATVDIVTDAELLDAEPRPADASSTDPDTRVQNSTPGHRGTHPSRGVEF